MLYQLEYKHFMLFLPVASDPTAVPTYTQDPYLLFTMPADGLALCLLMA